MELSPSPGATPDDGSPVRRARSRSLHAAVISLELKGEDRCLVRMDVSFGVWSLRSTFFVFPLSRLKKTLARFRRRRAKQKNLDLEASTLFSPSVFSFPAFPQPLFVDFNVSKLNLFLFQNKTKTKPNLRSPGPSRKRTRTTPRATGAPARPRRCARSSPRRARTSRPSATAPRAAPRRTRSGPCRRT